MSARAALAMAERTATLSPCGRYRYRLGRRWAQHRPAVGANLDQVAAATRQDCRAAGITLGDGQDRWRHGRRDCSAGRP